MVKLLTTVLSILGLLFGLALIFGLPAAAVWMLSTGKLSLVEFGVLIAVWLLLFGSRIPTVIRNRHNHVREDRFDFER